MSYCRFSECDVYAYDSIEGGVQFYVADGRRDLDRLCRTYNEAYQYMKTLRDQYELDVPDHAIEALKADALEEAACICGPDSAVAELKAENAKLRELLTFYLGCLTKGHVNCDSCAFHGPEDCNSGEKIIKTAKELGVLS